MCVNLPNVYVILSCAALPGSSTCASLVFDPYSAEIVSVEREKEKEGGESLFVLGGRLREVGGSAFRRRGARGIGGRKEGECVLFTYSAEIVSASFELFWLVVYAMNANFVSYSKFPSLVPILLFLPRSLQ